METSPPISNHPSLCPSPLSSTFLVSTSGTQTSPFGSLEPTSQTAPNPSSLLGISPGNTISPQSATSSPPPPKKTGQEDVVIHYAYTEDEHIIEYCPSNRYGKGAFKIVWKAIDFKEGCEVAWNSFQATKQESTELSQEIEILKRVRHPNIIAFRDAWYNNGDFVFITELITSGTLRGYIQKLKSPSLRIIRSWTRQILNGLLYLHSHNPPIIHRDIKCDNIFINGAHGEVKIGDMGTANMNNGKTYTVIGTPEFMAPEMYEEKGYSEKVDVYAFGMCLLEMITAEYPYSECKNAAQIYKKVSSGIKPECFSKVKDEVILSLILGCISCESERFSVKEIFDHPFYASEPELILLGIDEQKFILTLQVVMRGQEKLAIRFEFNIESDTCEEVVSEMIEEKVVPERYRHHLTYELKKQVRHFYQNFPLAMEVIQKKKYSVVSDQESVKNFSVATLPDPVANLPLINFHTTNDNVSASSESPKSWIRDSQYKAEMINAQRETGFALERARDAEKRLVEMETRIKGEQIQRAETDSLIESLNRQLNLYKERTDLDILEDDQKLSTLSGDPFDFPLSPSKSSSVLDLSSRSMYSSQLNKTGSPYLPGLLQQSTSGSRTISLGVVGASLSSTALQNSTFPLVCSSDTNLTQYYPSQQSFQYCLYPADTATIEELVSDVAMTAHRSPEKAYEWATKLQNQDILTVGDLRQLTETDWANLNLTVFAARALKNAINRKGQGPPSNSSVFPFVKQTLAKPKDSSPTMESEPDPVPDGVSLDGNVNQYSMSPPLSSPSI